MARIAKEAGISKALLYHYFPSKQAYFEATLQAAAEELRDRTEPDPSLPAAQQLERSLDVYLGWIEEHSEGYNKLIITAGEVAEVRQMVEGVRASTAQRILEGILGDGKPSRPAPAPRSAAGCGSWTARAWTGSPTPATSPATSCAAC